MKGENQPATTLTVTDEMQGMGWDWMGCLTARNRNGENDYVLQCLQSGEQMSTERGEESDG